MTATHPAIMPNESADVTSASIICSLPAANHSIQFSIKFGILAKANADAIVGLANPCFSSNSWQYGRMGSAQLASVAGLSVFEEAEAKAKDLINTDGIKTENGMSFPLGYAIAAGPGLLKDPLKGVILVNIWGNDLNLRAYPPDAVRLSVAGVLRVADDKKFKSVAFPALGTEVTLSGITVSLQESLSGIISGTADYFCGKASTQIESVAVMIDAQPTFENIVKMQDVLNDILRK